MDTMYQRGRIQDESLQYERRKHDGTLPLIGVNTFLPHKGQEEAVTTLELIRASEAEKQAQIGAVRQFQALHREATPAALARLQDVARRRGNLFAELMETVKVASLGEISAALYAVGGEYRRNM
jgi:methylmalonyl-CoA mutase